MFLENVVFDAVEPQQLGRSWEDAVGGLRLTDEPEIVETRLAVEGGPVLDLCFQRVPEPPTARERLHLVLSPAGVDKSLTALRLESADLDPDTAFWSWLTGWSVVAPATMRHPSGRGPLLELCPERSRKASNKNAVHLDVRLEAGDDPGAVERGILERGGSRFEHGWGDLPWRCYRDPSGNELCVLPART